MATEALLREFRADMVRSFEAVTVRIDSMEQQLRDLTGLIRSLRSSASKKRRKTRAKTRQPEDNSINAIVPGEVLEHIFAYLPGGEFMKMRAVCRRWRQVVDGCPALMQRARIVFPSDIVMDGEFLVDFTLPVGGATFKSNSITRVDLWWTLIGQELVCLKLKGCTIAWETLTRMLRQTPKLKKLELASNLVISDEVAPIELNQLEELTIYSSFVMQILRCPRLKRLNCWAEDEPVAYFLPIAQDTLEKLSVTLTLDVLNALISLKHLTELELRLETGLEDYWYFLERISEAMPKLKRLSISTLCESHEFSRPLKIAYLNKLTQLEYFKADGSFPCVGMLDFTDLNHPTLKELSFSNIYFFTDSFTQCLAKTPNIQNITLRSCKFENGLDLCTALNHVHRSLRYLQIENVPPSSFSEPHLNRFDALTCVRLGFLDESQQFYLALFRACPRVELVQLTSMPAVDDEVVLVLCQTAPRLKFLALSECAVTERSVGHIVSGDCPALEKFAVDRFCRLTAAAYRGLDNVGRHDHELGARFEKYVPGGRF